ncbi:MAG TPA: hypothetical protein VFE19_13005 [Jatrophihabitantaceae bacterium]|jgi:hypothetical protein|nr:hypothetical protein [Jatrophihabitantaceae bacterium]
MGEPIDPYGGQPYYQPYPPYPGWPGYPPQPVLPQRSGTAVAAAVLSFVGGGLLIIAAAVLFGSARVVTDLFATDATTVSTELNIDGFVNLIAAALLIPGGVLLLGAKALGQTLVAIGSVIVVVATVYWVIRAQGEYSGALIFGVLFTALAVVGASLAYAPSSRTWIAYMTTANAELRTPPPHFR